MGKSRVVFAALAMLVLFGTFAHAGIVYNNGGPNQQNGNEATEWVQTEDFTLTSATTITGVEFWDIEAAPGYAGSITWWITGDTGGNPDFSNILGTGNLALSSHTLTGNGCTVLGIYCEYDDTFSLSVALQGGVQYHLALHNGPITDTTRSEFYWETTNPNSTPTGLECDLTTGACYNNWSNNGNEHAFNLTGGTSTPEPGTLALFGTSVVGIAGMLRRKSNR
jgi:PEP-CTERM motif